MSAGAAKLSDMKGELPPTLRYLAGNQSGVVSRPQALRAGLTVDMIKFRVRSGRWRQIHPGVYQDGLAGWCDDERRTSAFHVHPIDR